MKKICYFFFLLIGSLSMSSCLDNDNSMYDDFVAWKAANEAYFTQMKDSIDPKTEQPYYKELPSEAYPDFSILYHEIIPGKENGRIPYYTSTVKVNYTGHLIDTKTPFDQGTDITFKVSSVISGWTWALMNMREGAKWQVVIPWQLAYGSNGSKTNLPPYTYVIPPFSTLVFEIELVDIPKWETGENTKPES